MARTLEELIDTKDPGWPLVQNWIAGGTVSVEVLPKNTNDCAQALIDTQVTTRSPMGAIVYESGGLLIDQGWLRVLGAGHPRLPRSLPGWNAHACKALKVANPGYYFVADDVLGGFFALDGGGLGEGKGAVYYYGPDTLSWENLEMTYSSFLKFAFSKAFLTFYKGYRWPGWESEVAKTDGSKTIMMYPFLWSKEGKDIAKNKKSPVPITETFALHLIEFPRQLG